MARVGLAVVGGCSGCLAVLVDESVAGGVSSDRLAGPIGDDFAGRRVGVAQDCDAVGACCSARRIRVAALEVAVVPDEGAVQQFAAHRADPAFGIGIGDRRGGRRADDRRAVAAEHVVERGDELAGARRGSGTGSFVRWSIVKFRAAWVVQAPVGCWVMPARCTRRVSSSMKNST